MRLKIHEDGSFDIAGSFLQLKKAWPAVEGRPIRTQSIIVNVDSITYQLARATIRLQFSENEDGIAIQCETRGLSGVHDISIIDRADVEGADKVFIQGLGMEGPSGIYDLTDQIPDSHGITALFNEKGCLFAYTLDHTRFSTCFRTEKTASLFQNSDTFTCAINLEGTTKDAQTLPTLYFVEGTELACGLSSCAEKIAKHMHARNVMPSAFHWCSWYYLYQNLDQNTLEEYIDGFRNQEAVPFRYIQIDAGYCPSLGDWLLPNHRFPKTLKEAARTISEAGYQPGVWIGPFMVGDQSRLFKEHPDWILKDLNGKPVTMIKSYTEPKVWGNRDSNYYILDASHPEALKYLKTVFETFRSWGFTYFKTDFMLWNSQDSSTVQRYDPSLTSVEILRNVLSVIRKAIGEESYLLGCIAPYMPFIGYADGMRIAGDVGAQWEETFGPVNLLREIPADNYFQNIYWQNDPDSVLLREFDTMLTAEETRSLALLQAVSGGVITTSDPVHLIGEDRKELLTFIQPEGRVTPELPYLTEKREELVMLHRLDQGNLLYILNPTDKEIPVAYQLDQLLGEKGWYQYRYDWEESTAVTSIQNDLYLERIAPHESALLFLTREPLSKKPENLWKW